MSESRVRAYQPRRGGANKKGCSRALEHPLRVELLFTWVA
jgi:hypothetical protein